MTTEWAYPTATQAGHVATTGELVAGPSGWTAERTDTGHYTVHHDLGTAEYALHVQTFITPDQAAAFAAVTETKPDYFCYRVFEVDGSDRNHDAQFLVTIA